jgi:hypothetical protein
MRALEMAVGPPDHGRPIYVLRSMRAAGKEGVWGGEKRRVWEGSSGKGWGWLVVLGREEEGNEALHS